MSTPRARTKAAIVTTIFMSCGVGGEPAYDLARARASPRVGGDNFLERSEGAGPETAVQRFVDHRRDAQERQPALEKRGDGDFVGGVESRRGRAAGVQRRISQPQGGKALEVGLLEAERADPEQVE